MIGLRDAKKNVWRKCGAKLHTDVPLAPCCVRRGRISTATKKILMHINRGAKQKPVITGEAAGSSCTW